MNRVPAAPGKGQVRTAILTAAACLYVMVSGCSKTPDLKSLATGPMAKLVVPEKPGGQPDIPFTGPDGKSMKLADLKGQVVVVNFWATWCGPCKEEMPSLAALQKDLSGQPFKVVAISVDRDQDIPAAEAFLKGHGNLSLYRDPSYHVVFGLTPRPAGIPTTLIYDKQGRERARIEGGADWSTEQAKTVIKTVMAES